MSVEVEGDKVIVKGEEQDQSALEKMIVAVGNTLGISQLETHVRVPDAREPVFHTVQRGDTLWAIATKHYGNGARYNALFEAIKSMLRRPDVISSGSPRTRGCVHIGR